MAGIVVVVPSRGRPEAARLTVQAIRETAVLVSTSIIVVVDADDPRREEYSLPAAPMFGPDVAILTLGDGDTGDLVRATNTISRRIADAEPDAVIGNLGDDHRPRTPGWDLKIFQALSRPGIAYGDDLIHGERLPSAPFISAQLVKALGWYFLPVLEHMYVDDATRELGRAAGVLHYLPDIVIEHMHPDVGKGEWDEGYRRVNADPAVLRDRERYEAWRPSSDFEEAVARIRAVA